MDQVSLPMRIALAAVLSFAALWFVALRPKPVSDVAPAPTPAAQPAPEAKTKEAPKARAADPKPAAKKAERRVAAKPAVARKAAAPQHGAEAVLADLEAKRTVVLLFWDGKTTDDRYVRRAVSDVNRHDGKVAVHVEELPALRRYEAITKGVPITTTPTTLVIGPDKQATVIRGLTVTGEVDDVVTRTRRAASEK